MATLKKQILTLVGTAPGLTDREMTDRIFGPAAKQQSVNQAARALAMTGHIDRRERREGKIGNYPGGQAFLDVEETIPSLVNPDQDPASKLSEDDVKRKVQTWLEAAGWRVEVIWGRGRGIDIEAQRDGQRWVIEAKGCGSLDAMRVNYFLAILGELLQRMSDPGARYSLALPDLKQFRGLWQRLPRLAKTRTGITALFVASSGDVREQRD